MIRQLGDTLIIANPVARSGKGADAAEFVRRYFNVHVSATRSCELCLTQHEGQATIIAATAHAETVIALGGDGLINEVVNGLMQIPVERRPAFAIIAMGTGNDFARTLNVPINNPSKSIAQIMSGTVQKYDVGLLDKDTVHERYFAQTLSFGLDAAVAIDTIQQRVDNTAHSSSTLFMSSALKIIVKHRRGWQIHVRYIDEAGVERSIREKVLMFAVQQGKSYGGGFQVTPDADPCDGNLNLCYNIKTPSLAQVLRLFGLMRFGKHKHSRYFKFDKLSHLEIEFDNDIAPGQIDGEEIKQQKAHTIDIIPHALKVIC